MQNYSKSILEIKLFKYAEYIDQLFNIISNDTIFNNITIFIL